VIVTETGGEARKETEREKKGKKAFLKTRSGTSSVQGGGSKENSATPKCVGDETFLAPGALL